VNLAFVTRYLSIGPVFPFPESKVTVGNNGSEQRRQIQNGGRDVGIHASFKQLHEYGLLKV
jgi:hypothetical protein